MKKIDIIPHSKPFITSDDCNYIKNVLRRGILMDGKYVCKFETFLKKYLNIRSCFAIGSGTAALFLALKTLNIGKGDEVALPTYVCSNVLDAIVHAGAAPVFCDIGKHWNMTPATVAPHLSKRTKAIVLVHLFGITVNIEPFLQFKIPIIEDRCQAFAKRSDRYPIKSKVISFFSFHATKCLTTGTGGAIVADDSELCESLKMNIKLHKIFSPMNDIQAALGISQLKRYSSFLKKRLVIADYYLKHLPVSATENICGCKEGSIFFRFPVINRKGDFDAKKLEFEKCGIAVRRGVDALLHRKYFLPDRCYPNSVDCYNKTISLPIYPALLRKEMVKIVEKANIIL